MSRVIRISEWDSTGALDLSKTAVEFLRKEVNDTGEMIRVEFTRDGSAILHSKSFVGTLALPDGPTIEIRPKAAGTSLVNLLRYAQGTSSEIIREQTTFSEGTRIVDTIAVLFLDELRSVFSRGLRKSYQSKHQTKKYVRGQINVQRQVQCHLFDQTQFECDYEELTYDCVENQVILAASTVLSSLTSLSDVSSDLLRYVNILRRIVTMRHVQPKEIRNIELNRLNDYYEDILSIAETVLNSVFAGDLEVGSQKSYSLLINMNRIFEQVLTRATREAFPDQVWTIKGQERVGTLVRGTPDITMRPDIVVDFHGETVAVADAKWKMSQQNSDIYQMVSYQLAEDAPGLLIYPEQQGQRENRYDVRSVGTLKLVEVPTADYGESYVDWRRNLIKSVRTIFAAIVDSA